MTKAQKYAHAGAAFLDKRLGRSWRRRIRLRDLDILATHYDGPGTCGCILAQLEGSYRAGADAVGIDPWGYRAERLGFCDSRQVDGDDLTSAWKELLASGPAPEGVAS